MMGYEVTQEVSEYRYFQQNTQMIRQRVLEGLAVDLPDLKPQPKISSLEIFQIVSSKVLVRYVFSLGVRSGLTVKGGLKWANGEDLFIQQKFLQTFIKAINKKASGRYFVSSSAADNKLRLKYKIRNPYEIKCLSQIAHKSLPLLNERTRQILEAVEYFTGLSLLNSAGNRLTFNKKLKLKQQSLKSYKKIVNFLHHSNKTQKHQFPIPTLSEKKESIINYYSNIIETQEFDEKFPFLHYLPFSNKFSFSSKICHLTFSPTQQSKQLLLTQKKVNEESEGKSQQRRKAQLNRGINIIKKITKGKQYFIKYYLPKENSEQFYRGFHMETIADTVKFGSINKLYTLEESLHYFKNIANGVQALHSCGIVHRDLKPENILMPDMLKGEEEEKSSSIKIIDFSDSICCDEAYSEELANNLGYTFPYTPFQCYYQGEKGVNNPQIDLWSLGIILYELISCSPPSIQTNCCFMEQFRKGVQRNQFSFIPYFKIRKSGVDSIIWKFLQAVLMRLIQFKPECRLRIENCVTIAQELESFMILFNTLV